MRIGSGCRALGFARRVLGVRQHMEALGLRVEDVELIGFVGSASLWFRWFGVYVPDLGFYTPLGR